jgi:hypothetical protein
MLSVQRTALPVVDAASHPSSIIFFTHSENQIMEVAQTNLILSHLHLYKTLRSSNLFSIPDTQLFVVGDDMHVHFTLKQEYAQYFALLNGLFSFGITPFFRLTINRRLRMFNIHASIVHDEQVAAYLEIILTRLKREIDFREKLRTIRAKEKMLKNQINKLYLEQFI